MVILNLPIHVVPQAAALCGFRGQVVPGFLTGSRLFGIIDQSGAACYNIFWPSGAIAGGRTGSYPGADSNNICDLSGSGWGLVALLVFKTSRGANNASLVSSILTHSRQDKSRLPGVGSLLVFLIGLWSCQRICQHWGKVSSSFFYYYITVWLKNKTRREGWPQTTKPPPSRTGVKESGVEYFAPGGGGVCF